MKKSMLIELGIIIMTTIHVSVPDDAEAQLGKIHRKYAQLTVSPAVVTQTNSFYVTVRPWMELDEWKLQIQEDGAVIDSRTFTDDKHLTQHSFLFPDDFTGLKTIRLLGKERGDWRILLEESVELMPGFYDEVQSVYDELRDIEDNVAVPDAWVYNTMANVEDLLERMKTAESGRGWDLRNRFNDIQAMVEDLRNKQDPYEGKTGYMLRGYRSYATGEIQLYSSYLPKDFDPGKKYPTVIMLHGAWSNHHLALRRVMGKTNRRGETDASAKRTMPALPDVPYIVLAPNGYETMGYLGVAEVDALFPLVWMSLTYYTDDQILNPIDENKLYLTGLSMGGGGTGRIGIQHPGRFAAIAPVCGYFDARFRGNEEELPDFVQRLFALKSPKNMAENLMHVPVKLMHGDADPVVPPEGSRELHDILRGLDYHSELEMYPGVDHDAWTPAYKEARIFDWFSQFERDPYPRHVRFKTARMNEGAYWVHIYEPHTLRAFASVDAEIKEDGIHIQTANIKAMNISFTDDIVPMNDDVKLIIDRDHEIRFTPSEFTPDHSEKADVVLLNDQGNWRSKRLQDYRQQDYPTVPFPKLSGLLASTETRHEYVYGVNGSEKETKRLQAIADEMAYWGDMTDVRWNVLPEREVDYSPKEHKGFVLFSKVSSSSYIQDHIDELPIEVKGGNIHFGDRVVEKDQGFIFVYPIQDTGNLITICTTTSTAGLDALNAFAIQRFSFLGSTYGDFLCINKNGDSLWGGLFDKNWNIETIEDY